MSVEKIALIGTGVMGQNHARTLAENQEVALSCVVDINPERAHHIAQTYGSPETRVYSSINQITGVELDGAIIASPSMFHEEQAVQLLNQGVGVLIEKPAATSIESIQRLDELSRSMGSIAMVGHVELFNPIVTSLISLTKDEPIREMFFRRLGSVADQSRLYHDVVSDLMLHDIAIALKMLGDDIPEGEVESAVGRSDTKAAPDPASASVRFGAIDAHFRASRVYPAGKVRQIVIETDTKEFTADLLTKNITSASAQIPHVTQDGIITDDITRTRYLPQGVEQPLSLEQQFFLKCIRGEAIPENEHVSMKHAIKTMAVVEKIIKTIQERELKG